MIELVFLLFLILLNGVFAMFEAAMISSRRTRLQQRAEAGDSGAAAAMKLAENPDRFLSAIQIGITLVGILSGAIGGSNLARYVEPVLADIPPLAPYSEALSVGLIVLLITYMSLIIGELVPKRLALNNAEGISAALARPMALLARLTTPIIALLSFSTQAVLLVLGVRPSTDPPITEDEVKIMLEEGADAGVFEAAEQAMAENVFRLDDWPVQAVMTPYPEITWLDVDAPVKDLIAEIMQETHTIYPVFKTDNRNIIGIVRIKDLWRQMANTGTLQINSILNTPTFVPETATTLQALELFRNPQIHTAFVIDEHGSIVGLVTVLDILEAVIGDIPETSSPQAVQRDDGSWLVDGTFNTAQFEEMLELAIFYDEEGRTYQTISGFIMAQLGRIPETGDNFKWENFKFEVVDMDGRRVDKVLITQLHKPDEHPQRNVD